MKNLKGKTVFLKVNSKPGVVVDCKKDSVIIRINGEITMKEYKHDEIVVFGEVQFTKK